MASASIVCELPSSPVVTIVAVVTAAPSIATAPFRRRSPSYSSAHNRSSFSFRFVKPWGKEREEEEKMLTKFETKSNRASQGAEFPQQVAMDPHQSPQRRNPALGLLDGHRQWRPLPQVAAALRFWRFKLFSFYPPPPSASEIIRED